MFEFLTPDVMNWIVIPLLIIIARVVDVTIGTLRIIYVSKGIRKIAPFLGFFEVLIWIAAIGQVMKNVNSWINYLAYAFGFALGNYIGITIESKISAGYALFRIIARENPDNLIGSFKSNGLHVTTLSSKSYDGVDEGVRDSDSHVILSIIRRKELHKVVTLVNKFNPKAYFSVEDLRAVSDPYHHTKGLHTPFFLFSSKRNKHVKDLFHAHRKGK